MDILNIYDCCRYFSYNGVKYFARVVSDHQSWVSVIFVNQKTKEKSGYFYEGYLSNRKAYMNKCIKHFQRNNGHV